MIPRRVFHLCGRCLQKVRSVNKSRHYVTRNTGINKAYCILIAPNNILINILLTVTTLSLGTDRLSLGTDRPLKVGLRGSVGCAVRLETRRSLVQHPPRSATFFRGD